MEFDSSSFYSRSGMSYGLYVHQSNYKLQGLALLVPLATAELAILDMLGKISGKSISELIGKIHNTEIAVYQAL